MGYSFKIEILCRDISVPSSILIVSDIDIDMDIHVNLNSSYNQMLYMQVDLSISMQGAQSASTSSGVKHHA